MDLSPITLREAFTRHEKDLFGLRNLAPGTVKNYGVVYSTLAAYIETTYSLDREALTTDINMEAVEGFFRDHVAVKAPSAYEQRRSNLRHIIKWLMRKGHLALDVNYAEELPPRRHTAKAKRDRRLTDEEFLHLLTVARKTCWRNYFLLLVLRLTGRRIGEVVGDKENQEPLVWADIRWEEGFIEWNNNKGRKLGKQMPLTPRLRAVLEAWRDQYAKELGVDEPHAHWIVFPAVTATGYARKGHTRPTVLAPTFVITNPDKVIRPLLQRAGLWRGRSDGWHILRKTFANQRKQMASDQNRGDAWELAQIALDHEDVKTTRIYINDREDYERYAAWANATPELGIDAMAKIPELATLAVEPAPETTKQPAGEAVKSTPVDDSDEPLAKVVNFSAFARGRRALA